MNQYRRISDFLTSGLRSFDAPDGRGAVILFWYVGHGAFFGNQSDYCLLVQDTEPPIEADTSIRVASLARLLRTKAPQSTRIIVLDCCFAGQAAQHFQTSKGEAVAVQVSNAVHDDRGVALLCASSARSPARLESSSTGTLFGHAVMSVLREGDPHRGSAMSLRELCELTWHRLSMGEVSDPPRPEVHCPDQRAGEVAAIPLFPNPSSAVTAISPPPEDAGRVHLAPSMLTVLTHSKAAGVSPTAHQNIDFATTVLTGKPPAAFAAAQRMSIDANAGIQALLDSHESSEWRCRLIRLALTGNAARACKVLIPRIYAADRSWGGAAEAVRMLSPGMHDMAYDALQLKKG